MAVVARTPPLSAQLTHVTASGPRPALKTVTRERTGRYFSCMERGVLGEPEGGEPLRYDTTSQKRRSEYKIKRNTCTDQHLYSRLNTFYLFYNSK